MRRYWEHLWAETDVSLVDELFAEPYVRHNRNGSECVPLAQLKDTFVRYWASFGAAPEVRIDDLAVNGNCVWSRVTVRGWDMESGEARVVTFFHEARLVDRRIVETWSLAAPEVDWSPA